MADLIIFILTTLGCTYIVTESAVFEPVRVRLSRIGVLSRLFNCGVCMSFWMGLLVGVVMSGAPELHMAISAMAVRWLIDKTTAY